MKVWIKKAEKNSTKLSRQCGGKRGLVNEKRRSFDLVGHLSAGRTVFMRRLGNEFSLETRCGHFMESEPRLPTHFKSIPRTEGFLTVKGAEGEN